MGSGGIAPLFLTAALNGGKWSASRPDRFTAGNTVHWTGAWVGPRAGLDAVEKRRIPCPRREPNPGRAALWPLATPTKLARFPGRRL
jgi:hypothetical protein